MLALVTTAKRPTFKAQHTAIQKALADKKWKVSGNTAISEDGKLKLYFKGQAVHYSWKIDDRPHSKQRKNSVSNWFSKDLRDLEPAKFIKKIEEWAKDGSFADLA